MSPAPTGDRSNQSDLVRLVHERGADMTRAVLKGGMVIVVLAVWVPSLFWGFITDEHLTAWITQDGLGDAIGRAQEHQGNSPAYFAFIWLVRQVIGASTVALRLPSVLALLAAAYHLMRLGDELDRRDVGLIAAFVMLVNGDVLIRAVTARPYGILLLLLVVSIRYLLLYLQSRRLGHGLVWVITATASLHMTPFATAMLLPHLVLLWNSHREGMLPRSHWVRLGAVGAAITIPLAPQIIDLASRSDSLVISRQPSIQTLAQFIVPTIAVMAVLVGFIVGGFGERLDHRSIAWRMVVIWAVVPILLLYLVGVAGSPVVGVNRYRLGVLPGAGLVVGMVMVRLRRPIGYLAAVGALVMLSLFQLSSYTQQRQGWRESTEWARDQIEGTQAIMAYDFGLVEQKNVAEVVDPRFAGFFTAPALVYGVENPVRPLPRVVDAADTTAYLDILFVELTQYDTIALVTNIFGPPPDYRSVFADRLLDLGYDEVAGPSEGGVAATLYSRGG